MKKIVNILLVIPKLLIRFVWHLCWSLIKLAVLIAVIFFLLFSYVKTSNSQLAQNIESFWHQAENFFQGRAGDDASKLVSDILTDNFDRQTTASWSTSEATVYIESTNNTLRKAYQEAIDNWNATGAFTFTYTDSKEQADIIAGDHHDESSSAAGLAQTQLNTLTNQLVHVDVSLNTYYLLNETNPYSYERIVHTAEHELGHAIGLKHDDNEDSVMQSAGSYYGIQEVDIAAVTAIYEEHH